MQDLLLAAGIPSPATGAGGVHLLHWNRGASNAQQTRNGAPTTVEIWLRTNARAVLFGMPRYRRSSGSSGLVLLLGCRDARASSMDAIVGCSTHCCSFRS